MLFNSFAFVFLLLPIALAGFYLIAPRWQKGSILWINLCSLVFYGWWDARFVALLLFSIVFNLIVGRGILAAFERATARTVLLWFGIAVNLSILIFFKYAFPFISFLHTNGLVAHDLGQMILPIGISFFTFTQIGFLVECSQGFVKSEDAVHYTFFATFFPHLLAGPILLHREIVPQLREDRIYRVDVDNLSAGLSMFTIGLAKKCLIADWCSTAANGGFAIPGQLGAAGAWFVVLSYSLQLYFDFSGYSDMAIGLARMFNIRFPLNFNSPYKATSIIDFWQRWHMSLTRYFNTYLYNPIALTIARRRAARGKDVSRQGSRTPSGFLLMIVTPTVITMVIIGIWHGAGFQFVVFGALHALYLVINHFKRTFLTGRPGAKREEGAAIAVPSMLLTYAAVLIAQVTFRASSMGNAILMFKAMLNFGEPLKNLSLVSPLGSSLHHFLDRGGAGGPVAGACLTFLVLAPIYAIVWGCPNSQEIVRTFLPKKAKPGGRLAIVWQPNVRWALAIAALLTLSIANFTRVQEFIYFQF